MTISNSKSVSDPLQRALLSILLIAITGLLVFIFITYNSLSKLTAVSSRENTSLRVLKSTEKLMFELVDIETGVRGFIITQQPHYLEPYKDGLRFYSEHIKELYKIPLSDAEEKALILNLTTNIDEFVKIQKVLMSLQAKQPIPDKQQLQLIESAKEKMDIIRYLALKIEDKERNNLKLADTERKHNYKTSLKIFIYLSFVITLYFVITYVLIRDNLTGRKNAESKLKQSEETFSKLFYDSPFIYLVTDLSDGKILYGNNNVFQFYGYTREEMIGKTSISLNTMVHPEERETFSEQLKKEKQIRNFETKLRTKSGEIRDANISSDLVNIDGKECLITAIIDITENKKTEEKLQQLNLELERNIIARKAEIVDYKYAIDASSIVAITDKEGIIRYANDNFVKISGFSREELIGNTHQLVNSDYHPDEFFDNLWSTIKSGNIWKGEIRNRSKLGTIYWVDTTIIPFLDEEKKPYQYLVIRFDITEKKKTEKNLVYSEANMRTLLDNTTTAYVLFDLNNTIFTFNSEADRLLKKYFGRPIDKSTGFLDHFPTERQLVFKDILEQVKRGNDYSYEIAYDEGNGNTSWYATKFYGIRNDKGVLSAFIMQTNDITEQKKTEVYREKMTTNLMMRNKDLEQFAFIVSHNLRAPVANILGLSDLMLQGISVEDDVMIIKKGINTSIHKLDEVLRDLNTILKIKKELNEEREKIALSELVEDIKTSISGLISESGAIISYDFNECDHIRSFKPYLYSIFYNLITNSIKYKKENTRPEIHIQTQLNRKSITLQFSDNGRGFDLAKQKQQVFGLYKRFHHDIEGRGVGLYLVKTQIETLGGTIELSSTLNEGSTFTIVFEIPEKQFA